MAYFMSKIRFFGRPFTTLKGWTVLFLGFDGAFWALLLLRPVGHAELVAIDAIMQCIGPLLAVLLCLGCLRRPWRAASLFLGLGILAYVLGRGILSFNQLIAHRAPFPSVADLDILASYPLLLLGVLRLSARSLHGISRVCVGLDGLMIITAIITFSWYFVLGPTLLQNSYSLFAKVVAIAYPCGDLILLLYVLLLWIYQQNLGLRPILQLLSLGTLILVVTDSIYAYLNLHGGFAMGGLIDPLWSLGFQGIGLAVLALQQVTKHTWAISPQPSRSLGKTLLPYAFFPALCLLLLYTSVTTGDEAVQSGVYIGAAILVGLVLLRQMVTMRQMHHLYTNNEALTLANTQLEIQATHDALTGLPNRVLLWTRIEQMIHMDCTSAALLFVDINRFKEVNDTFGHEYGDQILQQVGERMRRSVDVDTFVSCISGDKFALFLPGADEKVAQQVVAKVNTALEEPFLLEKQPIQLEANIGIALYPVHGNSPLILCQHADVAMDLAKQKPERCALYDAGQDRYNPLRLTLLGALRGAIANGDLRLYYQPKVDMQTGYVRGVEALVRWQHPTQGFLPPDQFIPLAEQTGLITPLTRWVLETAVCQCREWLNAGLELYVAINLSMRNLRDSNLPDTIADVLAQYHVPPRLLYCEITESAMITDPERTQRVLEHIFALGVHIAIDDYGTGYASLSYLKRLPAEELKIDRAFVRHITTDHTDEAIVRSTVSLAHSLGMQVVAEGVEDQATWNLLASLKCDIVQGYYLSRPIPAPDLVRWLDSRKEAVAYGQNDKRGATTL